MQSPALAVDQERGAVLYHHAAEVGEGGGPTGHVKALAADRRHATTTVAPVRCLACAFGSAPRRSSHPRGCHALAATLGRSWCRVLSITLNSARNTSGTPAPVAAETMSGVLLAARVSRAVCCFSCPGVSASALLSATTSGFSPSPWPYALSSARTVL